MYVGDRTDTVSVTVGSFPFWVGVTVERIDVTAVGSETTVSGKIYDGSTIPEPATQSADWTNFELAEYGEFPPVSPEIAVGNGEANTSSDGSAYEEQGDDEKPSENNSSSTATNSSNSV
ncbi:hypothetical protein ACLI4U_14400 [Natrialbaceae archaeon A-CW2]